jgi:hypothetical protein
MVEHDSARKIGEYGATIFIYGEEQVALGIEGKFGDIFAV